MRVSKFRIYPTKAQETSLNFQLQGHLEVYNEARTEKESQYALSGKSDSCFSQIKAIIPPLRISSIAVSKCSYSSLQQTVRRLHKAYAEFFKGVRKRPRHKKSFDSIEYGKLGDGWKIKNGQLYIFNVGNIYINKYKASEFTGLVIKKSNGKWFVSFLDKKVPVSKCNHPKNTVAIDFGIKTFITTSTGQKIETPRFLKRTSRNLEKLKRQKEFCKKSGNLKRLKKKSKAFGKVHEKVANQRKDFLHKLSNDFVKNNGLIVIEDLAIKSWVGDIKASNAKIHDTGIGMFVTYLTYKAESAGTVLKKVSPAYTSQTCSCCGNRKELSLSDRIYDCKCGHKEDRDINAAKNILALGLESFSSFIL